MAQELSNPAQEWAEALEKKIQAKVKDLKKTYPQVYVLRVTAKEAEEATDNTEYIPPVVKLAYLKPASRAALSRAMATGKDDPFKYNEIILQECWIEGDLEIQTDDTLFLNASSKLDALVEFRETEIKKY